MEHREALKTVCMQMISFCFCFLFYTVFEITDVACQTFDEHQLKMSYQHYVVLFLFTADG